MMKAKWMASYIFGLALVLVIALQVEASSLFVALPRPADDTASSNEVESKVHSMRAAQADTEPGKFCAFGEARGEYCYMGEMMFCTDVRASTLFPGLVECFDAKARACVREKKCAPRIVDTQGKIKVHAYEEFIEISPDLVVAKDENSFAALYDRRGENLIPSYSAFWGCNEIGLNTEGQILCVRKEGTDVLNLDGLKSLRRRSLKMNTLMELSQMDVCAVARREGQGLFQFWSNRYRVGKSKYAVHVIESESGRRRCRLAQQPEGSDCQRLLVDAQGILCNRQEKNERIVEMKLTGAERSLNFRDWKSMREEILDMSTVEKLSDEGQLLVTDRAGLFRLLSEDTESFESSGRERPQSRKMPGPGILAP